MICYICNTSVGDLKALVTHYKIIHLLKSDSNYTCYEDSCLHSFSCLFSFKKHVTKKHSIISYYEMVNNKFETNTTLNKSDSTFLNNDVSLLVNNSAQSVDKTTSFNFENSVKQLYESTVQFMLSLYNNNNFNNSDVIYIQNGVKIIF